MSPQLTTDPLSDKAAKPLSPATILATLFNNSPPIEAISPLSFLYCIAPPRSGSPHAITEPSDFNAANADVVE